MYLFITYARMSSQPAQLFFKSKITFITSIVVIYGMKILFATVFMYTMWLVLEDMLLASCGPIETKKDIKFLSNHLTIANYFIVDIKYIFCLFLSEFFPNNVSRNFPVFFNVKFVYFELITVIVNFHISQI